MSPSVSKGMDYIIILLYFSFFIFCPPAKGKVKQSEKKAEEQS
jgi:hypothetical protein